jgi:hypothetical protein
MVDVTVPIKPILLSTQLSLYAPQTVMAEGLDGAGGSFLYGGLAVLPCWRWSAGPVALAPCAAVEAAFVFASGQGVDEPEQPFTWFPRFGVGAEFGYALSPRVGIAAGIFGNIQPARPTFIVQDLELFSPSLFALRVSAGIEFAL